MDKEIWNQYNKSFLEAQYGASFGGPYPSACLQSVFWAGVESDELSKDNYDVEFKPYKAYISQTLARFRRQYFRPVFVRVVTDNDDYTYEKGNKVFESSANQYSMQERLSLIDFQLIEEKALGNTDKIDGNIDD